MRKKTRAQLVNYLTARPGISAARAAKNLNVKIGDVVAAGKSAGIDFGEREEPPRTPVSVGNGIRLDSKRVAPRKPADSAKIHICHLPKGRAFPVNDLAEKLVLSPETLKRHAKDLGALQYVEVAPHDWAQCILNPETAKNYAEKI